MHDRPSLPYAHVIFLALVTEGGVGVLALVLGWLLGYPLRDAIRWEAAGWMAGALGSLPLLGVMAAVVWVPWPPFRQLLATIDESIVPLFRSCNLVDLALISALAGLGEEMLFRGVLQRALAGLAGDPAGPWLGLVASAMLFGIAHSVTRTYAMLATLIGAYLGLLWLATENLLIPIVAHALYDFLVLVYLVRFRTPPEA